MGAFLQFLTLAALAARHASIDTTTFADRATQVLVARAVVRHAEQDSTVHDYTALLRYRVSFGVAKRKWSEPVPAAVEEQAARLTWQRPNDLRVDLLGRRSASRIDGVDLQSTFAHPWFVPRQLGDSIRIFGASQTPAQAAPHPFARGAEAFYRYAAGDSITLSTSAGHITIQSITVTPRNVRGAFVAGRIWVDVATGDVVRFIFRFVGSQLWSTPDGASASDSAAAARENRFVSHILDVSADLEYSLQDRRHWMPYVEIIAGRVSAPLGIDLAVPFEARTTFSDYRINDGERVVFDAPFPRDTTVRGRNRGRVLASRGAPPPSHAAGVMAATDSGRRNRGRDRAGYLSGGGRFEIHRPPQDSLRQYRGWGDSLVIDNNDAARRQLRQAMTDLAHITASLPGDMTGRPAVGIAWQHLSDVLRYNRVEGTALSLGARTPLPLSFSSLYATLRYGLADARLLGRVSLVRDAPAGRLIVSGLRDLTDVDAFATGLSLSNTLDAAVTGHDDGAYLLAQGVRASLETSHGAGTEITRQLALEDEQSAATEARALVPRITGASGYFPGNPAVRDGWAMRAGVRIEHSGWTWDWNVNGEVADVAGAGAARLTGELRWLRTAHGWATFRLKGGLVAGADSVPQFALRAGGLNTVRGYDFGVSAGDALWATQVDVSKPGRGVLRLVGFADIGQAGMLSSLGSAPVLSGAGVGVSILGGLVRADLSHPITYTRGRGVRLDLMLGAVR
jgi:hypothetical protein